MKIQSKITMKLPRRKTPFFLVFVLQLVACSLWGQVLQKKTLTTADYSKWGNLRLDKISNNGQWISYNKLYESGLDTLFIKNTKSMKTHAFPLGNSGDFLGPDWFIYQTIKGVHLINLKTEKQETISNIIKYTYSPVLDRLLILVTDTEKESKLIIRNLRGTTQEHVFGVHEFIMDPTNQMVLYTMTTGNQNAVCLLELSKKNKTKILLSGSSSFTKLVWHKKGKALAFIQKSIDTVSGSNTIFYYSLSNEKLYNSNPEIQNAFLGNSFFIPTNSYELKISDDMQKVFFAVKRKIRSADALKDTDVQIWSGNAKWIYPMEIKRKRNERSFLALWNPQKDAYQSIANDLLPEVMLTGDQNHAILSNPQQYEPQYKREGSRDFYLVDLSTSKKELLLEKHSGYSENLLASPSGKYISYYQQENWWIYNIITKTHTNITKNIGQAFANNGSEHPEKEDSYPNLGWTLYDKEILLCDQYDIWAISPDGISARRLTHGRENQTQFRLAGTRFVLLGKPLDILDLKKGMLLQTTNPKGESAIYKWSTKSNKKLVSSTTTAFDQVIESSTGNTIVYSEQNHELSPQLMVLNTSNNTSNILVQSNLQQQQFYWGKQKTIQYKNKKGKSLQGILYYPAEYDPKKKYPMIVYIYEKVASRLHNKYLYPSQLTGEDESFNIVSFTSQGYFVLAPDISYEIGNPGISATDCVVSATNEVISKGLVLPNKIGLIGHSFGGYETDFIITQTNLFAAAVAGSAVSDLTSFYLTVNWNSGKPDMWRFESQQWRMEKSLFEDKVGYDRNSPIVHVKNIKTPLLSWTGGDDKQVNWNQSIEFYLALRRLEKQHIMLLYPNEAHTLDKNENKKDLSVRIHQWFDYQLKDTLPPLWIKIGLK